MNDSIGLGGNLSVKLLRSDGKVIDHPILPSLWKRLAQGVDSAEIGAHDFFQSHLFAHHRDKYGNLVDHSDTHIVASDELHKKFGLDPGALHLGSGLVTNVGVNAMSWNDLNNTLGSFMSNLLYHELGTGTTADAATDYNLQTPQGATNLSGTTNGYMTATNTRVQPNQIKSSALFTATGAIAVAEWALAMSNLATIARTAVGTPTSTTFPDSGASYPTAGNGLKGCTIEIASSQLNTPTTTTVGLITANSGTSLTIDEWVTLANAAASTPGANSAYVITPTCWDRKAFSVINLASGDTLQTQMVITFAAGG